MTEANAHYEIAYNACMTKYNMKLHGFTTVAFWCVGKKGGYFLGKRELGFLFCRIASCIFLLVSGINGWRFSAILESSFTKYDTCN